jgi:hypothetical protein
MQLTALMILNPEKILDVHKRVIGNFSGINGFLLPGYNSITRSIRSMMSPIYSAKLL